jgi:hypothetical protein
MTVAVRQKHPDNPNGFMLRDIGQIAPPAATKRVAKGEVAKARWRCEHLFFAASPRFTGL